MSTIKGIIQHYTATKAQWESKNPVLPNRTFGIEATYNIGNVLTSTRIKFGDGLTAWNNLPYSNSNIFDEEVITTTQVFGLQSGTNLQGLDIKEVIKQLVTPYQIPVLSNLRNNNNVETRFEIGTPLPANVNLTWVLSNLDNANQNGTVSASSSAFTNLGAVNIKNQSFNLVSVNGFTSTIPSTLSINLQGTNTNNQTITQTQTLIKWLGRIRWGSRSVNNITTQANINNLANNQLKENINSTEYQFESGFCFICIPSFLVPGNINDLKFRDASTGLRFPFLRQDEFGFPATISYNNGNATFNYTIFRSVNAYGVPSRLTIEL